MNFKVLYLLNHVKLVIEIKTQEPRNKKNKFVRSRMSDDRCKSILVMSNAVRHLLGAVGRICSSNHLVIFRFSLTRRRDLQSRLNRNTGTRCLWLSEKVFSLSFKYGVLITLNYNLSNEDEGKAIVSHMSD